MKIDKLLQQNLIRKKKSKYCPKTGMCDISETLQLSMFVSLLLKKKPS